MARWRNRLRYWRYELLTLNEKREAVGYAPLDGGDRLG